MIFLTKGNTQTLAGLAVPNGSIQLTLQADCTIIATPFGQVLSGIPKKFFFDSTGNLTGTCAIWSNAELSPLTGYLVNFYDADGARINQNPFVWVFSQTIGQSVDIGTIVPSSPSAPSYPGAVLLNPGSGTQTISTGNIAITNNVAIGGTIAVTGNITGSAKVTAGGTAGAGSVSGDITAARSGTIGAYFIGSDGSGQIFRNGDALSISGTTKVHTFPNNTGTIAELNLAQSWTADQTFTNILQTPATAFAIKDNQGGTRFSIPSGGVTASTLNNTNITGASTLTSISFITGVSQGSGLKHQRFGASCTTGATQGATCTSTFTWTSAFADANYTVACQGVSQANSPAGWSIESIAASNFVFRVNNLGVGSAAGYTNVYCIAIHD